MSAARWLIALMLAVGAIAGAGRPQTPPREASEPASADSIETETLPPGARIELVRDNARNPVAMAFAPDGRWFFTERTTGLIKMEIGDAEYTLSPGIPALSQGERGLLGIALDPGFAANSYLYVYYTSAEDVPVTGKVDNRVVRFKLQGLNLTEPTVMLKVPLESNTTTIHNSGNLHFGPDGKLYVSIGDYFNDANGQNHNTLPAKIHRFNATVPLSAPADNPFFANPNVLAKSIYAYGFRNPFDFDFDPVSGAIFAGENGVACDDEINRVQPGYNYGWRSAYPTCDDFSPGGPDPTFNTIPPLIAWPYSVAPTGVTFYRGDLFPEWKNDLFACHWKDGSLHHFKLNAARTAIAQHTILTAPGLGAALCNLDIETGDEGALYFFRDDVTDPTKEYRDIFRITRDPTIYASTFTPSRLNPAAGEAFTYTLRLAHYSLVTSTFAITAGLSPSTTLVSGSPQATHGAIAGSGLAVTWTGTVPPNAVITATYRVTVSQQIVGPRLLTGTMLISTDRASPAQRTAVVVANGGAVYLPVALRTFMP